MKGMDLTTHGGRAYNHDEDIPLEDLPRTQEGINGNGPDPVFFTKPDP